MGADQSVPTRPSLDGKQLSAHLSWCIQQTARIQHQQSLQHAVLFSPLILPSSTSASPSLLSHLSASLLSLHSLIDQALTNKDATQSGLTPKDERIRGYESNKETNPALAQLGATEHAGRDAAEEEWSREERAVSGAKWVQCSALCSSLLAATVQCAVLQDQRLYLAKRSQATDYLHDHASGQLPSVDAHVAALLQLLASSRALLASTFKDAHLYSLLFLCHEWMRVLRGLQSAWSGQGKTYTPPTELPPSSSTASSVSAAPLIGISLTSPPQSHLAPPSLSAASTLSQQQLQDMLDALLTKARSVDYALHRNELSFINDALATLAAAHSADRQFTIESVHLRRAGGRVAAVLQLQRRQTISAREIEMGVSNMRNRLSTLTTAITQLTASSSALSRRDSGSAAVQSAAYSEQLDKLVQEAHSESRALRDVFALFYPQLVAECVQRLDVYGYRQVRERQEIASRLLALDSTSTAPADAGRTTAPRPAAAMALPPPVPRRPSLSFEDKEKRGMLPSFAQQPQPPAPAYDDDGVAVITVTDDADGADSEDSVTLRDRLAREEQAAMAQAGHERRNSNPLEIHAIALETPGHTQHWWKEAPASAGGTAEAEKREEEEAEDELPVNSERLQVVEYSYGDDDDDATPSPATTPPDMSGVSVYPFVPSANTSPRSVDGRYPIATVPGTAVPVLTKLAPSDSPTVTSASGATQPPPPPPPRPSLPPPLPAGYLPPSPQRTGSAPVSSVPPALPQSASAPSLPALGSAEAGSSAVNVNTTRPSSRRRMPNNSIDISATPSFATTLASLLPPRSASNSVVSTASTPSSSAPPRGDDASPTSATSAPTSSPSPSLSPSTPQPRSIIKKGGGARRRSTSGQRVSFSEVVEERAVGGGREERAGSIGPAAAGGARRSESYSGYSNSGGRLGDEWLDRKELRLSNGDGVFYAHSPRYI